MHEIGMNRWPFAYIYTKGEVWLMETINSQQVIIALIFVCGLMLVWSVWRKQLFTIITKVIIGMGIIWGLNLILPAIAVGMNGITAGIVAILGIPGIIMLYVIQVLL